ncbi:MAG: DUF4350 domain-containing protein [Deltaproteobacteria bacterium]|nr:DUF4350 domain-containing protein [Deltaproteobacteria bacterium]
MTNPFSRRTLAIIIVVAIVSLGAAVVLTVLGDDLDESAPSAGADSYSVSAIGHRGLVDILAKLDIPVIKSRGDSSAKAKNGVLLILEPTVSDDASKQRLRDLAKAAPRVIVVLPKWYGSAAVGDKWIEEANMLPPSEVEDVLKTLDFDYTTGISRFGAGKDFRGEDITKSPTIRHDPQLVDVGEHYEPLVSDPQGYALLFRSENVYVLSDPDVMNNHGLRIPENALFTVNLIEKLRNGGPVIIDEVVHGYAQQPSLMRTLFRFQLVLATLQVLICALLAIWAAMVRFGPTKAAAPPLAPGKDFLIQNTAALLKFGGHHADALRRYLMQSIAAVRHALHAPAMPPNQMTSWLERVRLTRGGTISLVELERDAHTADTPQRTVEVADRVYRWRMEMINGSQHRS